MFVQMNLRDTSISSYTLGDIISEYAAKVKKLVSATKVFYEFAVRICCASESEDQCVVRHPGFTTIHKI